MNSISTLTEFLGWCTVINLGIYLFIILSLFAFRDLPQRINAKLFGISHEQVANTTFNYVAAYKLAITVFCFVPYVALKVMQ